MRVIVPQITWHSRDPVLTVDFDPTSNVDDGYYRIASGGGDTQVLIWRLSAADTLKPELTCVSELKRHEKPVNVVRFSPDGNYIASGGDDAYVIIWRNEMKAGSEETWVFEKSLRKHIEDVTDLSWSPDGEFLVSGSIDNTAVLWDVKKGLAVHVWSEKEHTGFVNGVSYDPQHEFVATMCLDRNLRFFDIKTKKVAHKALKYPDIWLNNEDKNQEKEEKENVPANENCEDPEVNATGEAVSGKDVTVKKKAYSNVANRLFQDEFLPTYCRRLSFSPKGELLLVPGGILPPGQGLSDSGKRQGISDEDVEKKGKDKKRKKPAASNNAVVLFCRHSWTTPCAVIPTLKSYSTASKFCPVYFERHREPFQHDEDFVNPKKNERAYACVGKLAPPKSEKDVLMRMPYRLVYAIATNDTVLIGDTASAEPLAIIRSIHLAKITDISWAANGRALMVSSTDGYCAVVTFSDGELGSPYSADNFPVITKDCFPILPPEPKAPKVVKKKTPKAKTPAGKKVPLAKGKIVESKDTGETPKKKPVKTKATPPKTSLVRPAIAVAESEKLTEDSVENKEEIPTSAKPKITPQKTTLDRWFRKTPKATNTSAKSSPPKQSPSTKKQEISETTTLKLNEGKSSTNPPEIIVLDDDSNPPAPETESQSPRKYPMTPPVKPVPASKKKNASSSPLLVQSIAGSSKNSKRQGGVSPEELHRLTTAPIKCRRLMNEPPVILQSSEDADVTPVSLVRSATSVTTEEKNGTAIGISTTSPKVTDPGCPTSPVSSNSSKAPRRVQLITLANSGPNTGNLG